MKITDISGAELALLIPVLDLNDYLIDHPAASFFFQFGEDLAIVDRAAFPEDDCMVIVETDAGFAVEMYKHQEIFGVITYRILKTF